MVVEVRRTVPGPAFPCLAVMVSRQTGTIGAENLNGYPAPGVFTLEQ